MYFESQLNRNKRRTNHFSSNFDSIDIIVRNNYSAMYKTNLNHSNELELLTDDY